MKKYCVFFLIFILFSLSCTSEGVELGLTGTWNISDLKGDLETETGRGDSEGTLTINCDNTLSLKWEKDLANGEKNDIRISATISADIYSKTLSTSVYYKKIIISGTDNTSNYSYSDLDFDGKYILNCNNLTLETELFDLDGTFYFTRQY